MDYVRCDYCGRMNPEDCICPCIAFKAGHGRGHEPYGRIPAPY